MDATTVRAHLSQFNISTWCKAPNHFHIIASEVSPNQWDFPKVGDVLQALSPIIEKVKVSVCTTPRALEGSIIVSF